MPSLVADSQLAFSAAALTEPRRNMMGHEQLRHDSLATMAHVCTALHTALNRHTNQLIPSTAAALATLVLAAQNAVAGVKAVLHLRVLLRQSVQLTLVARFVV